MIAVPLELVGQGIDEFCTLVNTGVEAWVQAGQVLCRLKENDPEVFRVILAANPLLSQDVLVTFERIGRRELYPYLLLDASPGCLMLSALPYETQVELYHGDVPVVVKRGGFTVKVKKKVSALTAKEAARVFDGRRVRPVAEQTDLAQKDQGRHRRQVEASVELKDDPTDPEEVIAVRSARAIVQQFSICREKEGDEDSPVVLEGDAACAVLSKIIRAELSENVLEEDAKVTLARLLTITTDLLVEARSALSQVKRDTQFDKYISNALTSVGHLRYILRSGGITR